MFNEKSSLAKSNITGGIIDDEDLQKESDNARDVDMNELKDFLNL